MGKLRIEELQKLLSCIRRDERVIVPPLPGYDSGVHLLGDKYLVVSTDPCLGVPKDWFGWLLVHYAASDVALFGAKPEFCTINLLGPLLTKRQIFETAMEQTCRAADELGMIIITGHTGTYDALSKLVGVCTAYGTVQKEKLITPGDAKPGDHILCTKSVGLETVVNFSLTRKASAQKLFGTHESEKLATLVGLQSCVHEALTLSKIAGVHALHDATEGGFVSALNEMAVASKVGFKVDHKNIPIIEETLILKKSFRLSDEQVLSMSSTGTIVAAVDPKAKHRVQEALDKEGVSSRFCGVFTENEKRVLSKGAKEIDFPEVADDPYARILPSEA
jgi:hydrogenase maturation factor